MNEVQYMEKWLSLNEKMVKKNFTWSTLEEDNDFHQYMSFNVMDMTKDKWDAIQVATKAIGNIANKTYQVIMSDKMRYFPKLGLPKESWDAVSIPSEYFSYFTRLDLVVNGDDIKLIEINCDTPTGYLETSVANEIICEDKGIKSPNNLPENIFRTWRMIEEHYGIEGEKIYFTSYGENEEDRQTVLFNMYHSGTDSEYIAVEDIHIDENGLYDTEGNRIENLYRLYPLEFLPTDVDDNGREIGKMFLDHIGKGKVKIINPPSAFLMQSKAVMAIIWSMQNDTENFTEDELDDIEKYFIPTYFDDKEFKALGVPHVEKPIFGREGGGVKIFDKHMNLVDKDEEDWYSEWNKIYQEYVEMPDYTLNTWVGDYTGKLLVGSFLIGGEPSGVFLRVGEKITGNLSMFCGVAVK